MKKTAVFYFSGTGNNLYIAKKLQEGMEQVKIYPFHQLKKIPQMAYEYERILYCVPSYFSHIPPYVSEVLLMVKYAPGAEIITIVGCGGNRGRAIEDLREIIQKSGQNVAGEYMVMLPGNYIISYNAFPKLYQRIVFFFAERKIHKIINAIKEHKLTTLKKPGIFYKEKQEPRLKEAIQSFAKTGKHYTVADTCTGCGTCEKVCPVQNIRMVGKRPQFLEGCQQCMACVQWCPKQAIDYNGKAHDRTRYHHREISLGDVIKENKQVISI